MSTKRTIVLATALVISAVLGGTLISAVAAAPLTGQAGASLVPAAPSAAATTTAGTGEYCAAYRAAFAKELGVTEAKLTAAAKAAAIATIDAAVADGDLTADAADRLKTRIGQAGAGTDLCKTIAGRIGKIGKAALGVAKDALTAAADALHMTPADLRAELKASGDLKAIATAKGVDYQTVTDAVLDAVKADLDPAVKAGTITQARADKILDRLADRLADGRLRPAR
jgi:ribosomal protein S20